MFAVSCSLLMGSEITDLKLDILDCRMVTTYRSFFGVASNHILDFGVDFCQVFKTHRIEF
jgi:hypothetical protein